MHTPMPENNSWTSAVVDMILVVNGSTQENAVVLLHRALSKRGVRYCATEENSATVASMLRPLRFIN